MPFRRLLFKNRRMNLSILIVILSKFREKIPALTALVFLHQIIGLLAALTDKVVRQCEVTPIPGCLIELYQGYLDLLVPRIALALAFLQTEYPAYQIRKFTRNIQKFFFARGVKVRYRGFNHMAAAV